MSENQEHNVGGPFLRLNRPQFANMPELLVSSIVWGLVERSENHAPLAVDSEDEIHDAVAFDRYDSSHSNSLDIGYTRAKRGSARWTKLVESLQEDLDVSRAEAATAAEILLDEIRALRPAKSKTYAAIPINLGTALMQDRRGLLRAPGPANYASILERMYVLGGGNDSAAKKLVLALGSSEGGNATWLETALQAGAPLYLQKAEDIVRSTVKGPVNPQVGEQPLWLKGVDTPFSWFVAAWDALCEDGWIERMPRRRWVDWTSCVLRNALGIGFLFEMNLLRTLVLGVVSSDRPDEVSRAALSKNRALLRWNDEARVSERSVREQILTTVQQGTAALILLRQWVEEGCSDPAEFDHDPDGLTSWVKAARDWSKAKGPLQIETAISQAFEAARDSRSANNVDETIMYALRERSDAPGATDLYGLLKRRGRYYFVDPGQEWLVVMSSLSAVRGQGITRVADVDRALRSLCLRPGYLSIVRRLEASGLARGSHDADEAIEVQVAF
ncbi:hypothetical protein [Parasedimentitalea psychrophila]|uniref:Uncharacterized protein n=1 Tax=Parasedimentitalea psychrophila TaxID=2997337 RepID=A0A9Y2P7N5_9RHOB|nr:hypothetical protein [Parasedimentitalea psychrophila]WIY26010.1 hypothetical protein QPJ95_03515 [Parasedimentitalea psychrophila]